MIECPGEEAEVERKGGLEKNIRRAKCDQKGKGEEAGEGEGEGGREQRISEEKRRRKTLKRKDSIGELVDVSERRKIEKCEEGE